MARRHRAGQAALRRALGVTALSLAVLIVGATHPAAAATAARGIDGVCPPPSHTDAAAAPTTSFPDAGATHGVAIQCAADYGMVAGFPDGTYRPGAPLNRGQMASVLRRLIETATGAVLPVPGTDPFIDIAAGSHRDAIAALEAAGVVAGGADGRFDPGGTVTRGQMARLLVNALDRIADPEVAGSFPPPDATVRFGDVAGTTFQADIQALAAQGVVQGIDATTYGPSAPVTRGQLATFLMRAADLLAGEGFWGPTAGPDADLGIEPWMFTVALTGEAVVAADETTGQLATGQGQTGASGSAVLVFDPVTGSLTFAIDYARVQGPFDAAAGARLQRGVAGTAPSDNLVLVLATGAQLEADADRNIGGVLEGVDVAGNDVVAAMRQVIADPTGYYLSIRSNLFSWGAIRGQLTLVPR